MGRKPKDNGYEIPAGKLWPNMPSGAMAAIEVFGATGEYKSGKTLLGLSIAPGVHSEGHKFEGQPRTLYLDFEKSGGTYSGTGANRIDMPSVMESQGINYTPVNVFKWFLELIKATEVGRFDVIVADPATDIESGLVDYVKSNCQAFGLSPNQVTKGGGLLWGAVKAYWKQVLLVLSTRCQCFFFTAHLRDEWSGDRPTGRREPKGKDTLMELASLYLWLERKPDDKGVVAPVPSAIVIKERLADIRINEDGDLEIVQLMPARIPVANINAIRHYIANPCDPRRPKVGERVVAEMLSSDDKLRLELAKAQAEQGTEENRVESLRLRATLQAEQRAQQEVGAAKVVQPSDQTAVVQAAKEEKREAEAAKPVETEPVAESVPLAEPVVEEKPIPEPAPQSEAAALMESAFEPTPNGKATRTQQMEILRLFDQVGIGADTQVALLARADAASLEDLSKDHALLLVEKLTAKSQTLEAAGKN